MESGQGADSAVARVGCTAERMAEGTKWVLEQRRPGEKAVGYNLGITVW